MTSVRSTKEGHMSGDARAVAASGRCQYVAMVVDGTMSHRGFSTVDASPPSPKLRVVRRRFPWLSWGFVFLGVVLSDYAAVSGMGAPMRVKARRWSGVGSVSMGIWVSVPV